MRFLLSIFHKSTLFTLIGSNFRALVLNLKYQAKDPPESNASTAMPAPTAATAPLLEDFGELGLPGGLTLMEDEFAIPAELYAWMI